MKPPSLSKPLQAGLLMTVMLTAIALLKPEALDASVTDGSPVRAASNQKTGTDLRPQAPWIRLAGEEWKPSDAELQKAADALVAAAAPVVTPPPVVEPPKPTAPDPALAYLGRIDQDGRHYVFLGRGADPQVVEIGGLVDPQWKVEKATATQVQLRYLPLNEVRSIPVAAVQ
ncbi:hypothetical protein J2W25_000867 [Variovorax boronicumulans]|uniref:Uncharacterized protein n=1 Tax=Variovorax boronicumulans TaxID=436515 RepID=A0AAW8DR80_9BURK|nr:hypothetical protein [Variovorax boronicumulans]MDP9877271.1 hypothetical protein [Variovorax boronicumulans]MDP9921852.1 hypothetical protein [Variovorax boronicumulans]